MDRAHVAKIDPLQLNNEKRLKRIATKGGRTIFLHVLFVSVYVCFSVYVYVLDVVSQ